MTKILSLIFRLINSIRNAVTKKVPMPPLLQVNHKITGTDMVMVATFSAADMPYVFISTFNPKLQKAKAPDPLQFTCEIHDHNGPTLFHDRHFRSAFTGFFEQNPTFGWLLDWNSDEWKTLKANAKPVVQKDE